MANPNQTWGELFSNTFSPSPLKHIHSHTIPYCFHIWCVWHSNEENKKITVEAEKGEGERKRSLLQSCDTEAGTAVEKPVLLSPPPYLSLVNLFLSTLRGDTWLQFANSGHQFLSPKHWAASFKTPWNFFWFLKLSLWFLKHLDCNCPPSQIHLQKTLR